MKADFIKQSLIKKFGFKSQSICDEVGLPVLEEWATTMFADVMEVKKSGNIVIYEVKSCIADFQADKKYHNYLKQCHLLYFVADEKTILHIKDIVELNIGLYKVHDSGYVECLRRAKNTKLKFDVEKINNGILKKSNYRYLKFWYKKEI
jgi:hypothetical protein